MDLLTEELLVGVVGLCLLVVDTYFWIRTTLRLREWGEEIQPRLGLIDTLAQAMFEKLGVVVPSAVPQGATVSDVKRTKKGSPYVIINQKARFLSEAQAAALSKGVPAPQVLGSVPIPTTPTPSPRPPGIPQPQSAGAPDLDYAAMAAELGQPEEVVRAFVAKHTAGGPAVAGGPPGAAPAGSNAPTADDQVADFLMDLVSGKKDWNHPGAREMARQLLSSRQTETQGLPAPGGDWVLGG